MGSKKKRGGKGTQSSGNTGGSGTAHLSKEKLAALDVLAKKEQERLKKADRKDLVKHVTKQIRKKGVAGSSSVGESPKASFLQGLMGDSSDSSSTSDSSDDGDKKRKKRKKKRKAAFAAAELKFAEMEDKIKDLEAKKEASEALRVSVETHLTPTKGTTRQNSTLDRTGWDELVRRAQPAKKAEPGLLSPLFEEEEEENSASTKDFLVILDNKLSEANEVEPFNGKPGKVGSKTEAGVKKLASQIADLHFPGKDTNTTEFEVLKDMKAKYIESNASRNPDTIMAAILRSLVSRKVDLSRAEAGL